MNKQNCPFCQLAQGTNSDKLITTPAEIIHQNQHTTSFIACDWWPNNKGHVIVIPNQHFDNLYDIDEQTLSTVYKQAKTVAQILKDLAERIKQANLLKPFF